ncbi:flavohemoprotein [[Candida] railenensis]|uniref:nitric oxide dioxygenase n=1 Tax=[Candida] railenensis TaxID=45579 RepID=A0A9P0QQ79_9ASCO|nr:flavohemoprotein [[Candida] railenensis]
MDYTFTELTDEQKKYIKATIPYLEKAGVDLTAKFYSNMLEKNEEVRPFFNKAHQATREQPAILAFALLAYAQNIDDLTPLVGFVKQIIIKHTGLQIKPHHYPIVGTNLLETMVEVLGSEVASPPLIEAWATAYGNLAKLLIDGEREIYEQNQWDGFREFEVTSIEDESSDVKSVQFKPKDATQKVQIPQRGQYVGIRFTLDDGTVTTREYSLSSYDTVKNNKYQISVKRDRNGGIVSNFVHDKLRVGDTIKVSPPNGNFVYRHEESKPVLIFTAGIGITPMVSIMQQALESGREVIMHYSNSSVEVRPFTKVLQQLKEKYGKTFTLNEYISQAQEQEGSIKLDKVSNRRIESTDIPSNSVDYDVYLLGPSSYNDVIFGALAQKGVEKSKVATEVFGVYKP